MAIGIFQRGLNVFVLYDDKRWEQGPLLYEKFPTDPSPESLNAAINFVDAILARFTPTVQAKITSTGPLLPPTGSGIQYIDGSKIKADIVIKGTNQNVMSVDPYLLCEAIQTRNLHVWAPTFLKQLKDANIAFVYENFSDLPEFRMF